MLMKLTCVEVGRGKQFSDVLYLLLCVLFISCIAAYGKDEQNAGKASSMSVFLLALSAFFTRTPSWPL